MNDAFLVGSLQPIRNFDGKLGCLLKAFKDWFMRSALDPLTKGLSFQQLHDNERLTLVFTQVIDRTDVGVIEGGRSACLALKSFESPRVTSQFAGKKFDSDAAPQFQVFGLIYNAHPTATQQVQNTVVGNLL